jgi:hypothetical protein
MIENESWHPLQSLSSVPAMASLGDINTEGFAGSQNFCMKKENAYPFHRMSCQERKCGMTFPVPWQGRGFPYCVPGRRE